MMLPRPTSRAASLGAGAVDPFANYPINMTERTHELFLHCKCREIFHVAFPTQVYFLDTVEY